MSETIKLTPTWRAVMPVIIAALEDGTENGKQLAREELTDMAKKLDAVSRDLTAIVRERIFGDGTVACEQQVIDLCRAARERYGIERED